MLVAAGGEKDALTTNLKELGHNAFAHFILLNLAKITKTEPPIFENYTAFFNQAILEMVVEYPRPKPLFLIGPSTPAFWNQETPFLIS